MSDSVLSVSVRHALSVFLTAAKRFPERSAFVCSGAPLSYRDLEAQLAALAGFLRERPEPGFRLQICDHALSALALMALVPAGKVAESSPEAPILQDSDIQNGLYYSRPMDLDPFAGDSLPFAGIRDGEVFANVLPYDDCFILQSELENCFSVGGCVWFCEGLRGMLGLLPRIRPHRMTLGVTELEELLRVFRTDGLASSGGDRLRQIFCTRTPSLRDSGYLRLVGILLSLPGKT